MEFNKALDSFSNYSTTIINYFEERLTNASAESFNAKIKAFLRQLRGVTDVKFFMFRLAYTICLKRSINRKYPLSHYFLFEVYKQQRLSIEIDSLWSGSGGIRTPGTVTRTSV